MKKFSLFLSNILALTILAGCTNVAAISPPLIYPSKAIKAPFPTPKAGYIQKTIHLPQQANENNQKVELIVGQKKLVDCNHHSLSGRFVERTLQGWGYRYWEIEKAGAGISTMMGCMGRPKTMKFIQMQPKLIRYNSRVPIHVYLPKGYELRYRIWSAGSERTVP